MMAWQAVGSEAFELGESPFWHPLEQTLYWVDIAGKKVLRANVYMGTVQAWDMPSEPGCIAPAAAGGLVIALRSGVFRARDWGGALELIATLPYDPRTVRANDGKCDALGRFWIGTVDETKTQRTAALYSLDCRQGHAPHTMRHAGDALTINGLAWSPDNQTLYWADTPSHTVHACAFDLQTNTLGTQRVFAPFEPKPPGWVLDPTVAPYARNYGGRPDGAAVDILGNYYVALYEGQRVCQFAPDGRMLGQWPTPMPCPTMPCLGGEDGKTLYIASARHGRNAQELAAFPESGRVFAMRVAVPGLPVNFFVE